jgi:phenylacetate-coenzyme A ligase PaaK-like adenylate-forming protein
MQIGLINSIATWWFNKRMSDLRLVIKNPVNAQEEQLRLLIERASGTVIGKKYHFEKIHSVKDFRQQVPLHSYNDLFPYIEEMMNGKADILWPGKVKWFAKSSGTTAGKSKFIPVTEEALELNHYQGAKDAMTFYLNLYPKTGLLHGKTLKLGGSKQLLKFENAYVGDLSAIMIDNMPLWSNLITIPEKKTALLSDWEEKLQKIIAEAIPSKLTGLAGVPSWMLMFLQEVLKQTGKKNIQEVWPDLEVFFHGGVSFAPYKEAYKQLFPSGNFNYFEIYNASEGFFALQDRKEHDDLLLMLNHGIFYEFIPVDTYEDVHSQTVIPLQDVELNKNYAMVISTNSGLWRYILGDTVRFTSLRPYRIKITGRTKHYINVFGEEVIIENTDKAIEYAANKTGAMIKEYTLAPVFMEKNKKGAHEWIIEFDKEPDDFEAFKKMLDMKLQSLNSDYEAKRYKNMTLTEPVIHKAQKNLFYTWMKNQGKLGGQNKVPRLSNERKFIENLLKLNQKM